MKTLPEVRKALGEYGYGFLTKRFATSDDFFVLVYKLGSNAPRYDARFKLDAVDLVLDSQGSIAWAEPIMAWVRDYALRRTFADFEAHCAKVMKLSYGEEEPAWPPNNSMFTKA